MCLVPSAMCVFYLVVCDSKGWPAGLDTFPATASPLSLLSFRPLDHRLPLLPPPKPPPTTFKSHSSPSTPQSHPYPPPNLLLCALFRSSSQPRSTSFLLPFPPGSSSHGHPLRSEDMALSKRDCRFKTRTVRMSACDVTRHAKNKKTRNTSSGMRCHVDRRLSGLRSPIQAGWVGYLQMQLQWMQC